MLVGGFSPTHLKHMRSRQIGSSPQIGMNIKKSVQQGLKVQSLLKLVILRRFGNPDSMTCMFQPPEYVKPYDGQQKPIHTPRRKNGSLDT